MPQMTVAARVRMAGMACLISAFPSNVKGTLDPDGCSH
jgi:hypothetical protein